MKKKLTVAISALGVGLISLPLLVAFEAHVINVTAQIANGILTVPTEITYGTVFPQEKIDKTFQILLSESFLEEPVGEQCASSVESFSQGVRKNGTPVLANRSNPTAALGSPQTSGTPFDNPGPPAGSFVSLGFTLPNNSPNGGTITLGFTNFVVDVAGPDFTVYEVTGGTVYPEERVRVEVSQDGITFETAVASGLRDVAVDISGTSFDWIKFVRITDVSNIVPFESEADAYDLDAVCGTSREHVGIVDYVIRQKPKCGLPVPQTFPVEYSEFGQVTEDVDGNFVCVDDGFVQLPLLCPYLSKHEVENPEETPSDNDGPGINAFHGLPLPWTLATAESTDSLVYGVLDALLPDEDDTWVVDLRVPCFAGSCAQDWADFVRTESGNPDIDTELYTADPALEHEIFGCDLWVEVTDIE